MSIGPASPFTALPDDFANNFRITPGRTRGYHLRENGLLRNNNGVSTDEAKHFRSLTYLTRRSIASSTKIPIFATKGNRRFCRDLLA
jgi:hypothetical protein